ncbi:MAG TPA: hypothetical protein VHY22_19200 [Chthoniobacteraceae bacterium]|nr:hypothetical protein [Chthoniobacteraceae bacterium]
MARPKKSKNSPKGKRLSRPYPQVSLERALIVATAIKDKNGGNPFAKEDVAVACGVSVKSTAYIYLLSASARFGLTDGSISSTKISLAPLGKDIVYCGSAVEELELKRKAFLSVDLFRRVVEHYKGSQLPEMKYLGNTLQKEFGLTPELHEEFSTLFRENCRYLNIDQVELDTGTPGDEDTQTPKIVEQPRAIVLGQPKTKTGGTCFVIMPFTEKTQRYPKGFFSEVLNSLIIPAATASGFEVKTANRQGTEIIHSTIVNEVLDADLAICDLTEHNPNVLFELGIRLANEKPVALIHAEATERIFDVDNVLRVFPYSPQLWRTTLDKDIPALRDHITATWLGKQTNDTYMGVLRKLRQAPRSNE